MVMEIGYGCIHNKDGEISYKGTLPKCDDLEPVCVVRQSDLELIMHAEEMILLRFPFEMRPEMFEKRTIMRRNRGVVLLPVLPDKIIYHAPDGTEHKLFLDRHYYSSNAKDMLFIRYASVDEYFIEEQP